MFSMIVNNTFDFCTGKPTFDLVLIEFGRIPIAHSGLLNTNCAMEIRWLQKKLTYFRAKFVKQM